MRIENSGTSCHSCGARRLTKFTTFEELHRVSSDSKPWPGAGELALCEGCGLVQKPVTAAWQEDADAIYAQYHMYHQSASESEQRVAVDNGFMRRSDVLLNWAKQSLSLSSGGRYLDYGCGNGATLRSASALLDGWQLYGYEPNANDRAALLAIPGVQGILSTLKDAEWPFDFLSMMHVLEHIPDPSAALKSICRVLKPNGYLFIQVPYFVDSPYELVVADHCTHFTVGTLTNVVRNAGLRIVSASSNVLKKEITLVAQFGGLEETSASNDGAETRTTVERQIDWLRKTVQVAEESVHRPFGIFGTSIAGSWLYAHLAEVTDFFVDEDESRTGRTFMDRPIYHPRDIPDDGTVFVALIPEIARKVIQRHSGAGGTYVLPPSMTNKA